jgi:hypothetical protein
MRAAKRGPAEVVDTALAAILADPRQTGRIIAAATQGKHGDAVWAAMKADRRFAPAVCAALRAPGGLRDAPWIVQLLGHQRHAPAVPDLLALWRRGTNADQAGHAILDIGDPAGLKALAREVKRAKESVRYQAIRAALRIDATTAFATLAPLVRTRHRAAAEVMEAVAEGDPAVARDRRWRQLALQMIRDRRNDVIEQAWALLRKQLSPAQLGKALAAIAPTPKPPTPAQRAARQRALAAARAAMTPAIDALVGKRGVRPAARSAGRTLAMIEKLVGPIPARVHAFYQRIDSVAIGPARTGVTIVPLAEVAADAQHWARQWGAPHAPRSLIPAFAFPVAPDPVTRSGHSGGPAYGFDLPAGDEDPRIAGLRGSPRFSELVTRAARMAGGGA